jgi:hypothetical protein
VTGSEAVRVTGRPVLVLVLVLVHRGKDFSR